MSETPSLGASGRAFILGAGALLLVRMCLTAHAPAFVDGHAALAALALAFVARASRPALVASALVVTGAVVSIPTSWDPWVSTLALPSVLGSAGFFLLASSGSTRSALLAACGVGGALNAIVALVQKTITWPAELARLEAAGLDAAMLAAARPIALSLSPDLAGGMCLAGAFSAFALALDLHDRKLRVALVGVAAVSISALLVVRSFGTVLAFVAGVGVVALLWSRRAAVAGVVVGGAAFALAAATRGLDALGRSAGERIENWRTALDVFADAPLFGVGLARFGAAYLAHRPPEANVTRYAHSAPLHTLAETGLVGGALALAALVVVLRAVWRRRATLTASDRVLVGGAVALGARACIDYDLQIAQSAAVAAVIVGVLVARDDAMPAGGLQRRALAVAAVVSLAIVAVLGWRQSALEVGREALVPYVESVPFDVEPRLALAAQAVDAVTICNRDCEPLRAQAIAHLDVLCAREHAPAVAFVLRARAHATAGRLGAALADVDEALARDKGNAPAHQLGVAIANALQRSDRQERVDAAQGYGVDISMASQITF